MFKSSNRSPRLILLLCAAISGCVSLSGCHHSESDHGVAIVGSDKFVNHISEALALIHSKAPDDLKLIATYVKRIEEHDRSGMNTSRDVPTCQLAPATAYASLTWCAGCIAHESYHSKLYHSPPYVYGGAKEEHACNEYQLTVMRRI